MSNRGIKSLQNNFIVKATKDIINTPKIAVEKPQIAAKPKIVIQKNTKIMMNIKIV